MEIGSAAAKNKAPTRRAGASTVCFELTPGSSNARAYSIAPMLKTLRSIPDVMFATDRSVGLGPLSRFGMPPVPDVNQAIDHRRRTQLLACLHGPSPSGCGIELELVASVTENLERSDHIRLVMI